MKISIDNTNYNYHFEIIESIIEKLKKNEVELEEMTSFQESISETSAPSAYKRISQNISDLQKEISSLKNILNDKNLINQYINNHILFFFAHIFKVFRYKVKNNILNIIFN